MKRKLFLAVIGVITLSSLAACSGDSKDIATIKGDNITIEDFYNQIKTNSNTQSQFSQMIVSKVFEKKYGNKITDKEVQSKYDEVKKQLEAAGTNFSEALKQQNLTETTYKEDLKQQLAFEAGKEAHLNLSDKDIKAAWETFHPEVTVQIIQVASEDDAKNIKKDVADGKDFSKIAKEKSIDTTTKQDAGKIKFDSQSTNVPTEVKETAFKLKDGEISDPITSTNAQTYQTSYFLVKMNKNKEKGNDIKPYEKEIKTIAKNTKLNDEAFIKKVIAEELKEANVKIKDNAFKDSLDGYLQTNESK